MSATNAPGERFIKLIERLGYRRFVAQGGDWGERPASFHPTCRRRSCPVARRRPACPRRSDARSAYRDLFASLASHGVLTEELGRRLVSATGLRNLLAHQYGALGWTRVHAIAASELDDLLSFCRTLADKADG